MQVYENVDIKIVAYVIKMS